MTDEVSIWHRQSYETSAAFTAFHEYYLSQDPPRQVVSAYNRWRKSKYGANIEQRKQANGTWNNWAAGKTSQGVQPEGSCTWQARATAYDDHLAQLREVEFEKRHMGTVEALALLADQARASHADFADVNMRDDLKDHPKAHLVKTVVTDTYEDAKGKIHHKMKLELYDAQAAIRDILKIHGKFTEKVEHTGPGGGPIEFTQVEVQLERNKSVEN